MGFAEPREAALQGRTVLFIDDDRRLLRLMVRALEESGARCLTAGTYDEGIRLAEGHPGLDLAVLDFDMPDGDVADLARRLRAARPGIRLVGTSGRDRRGEFAMRGIELFLGKPWAPVDLAFLLGG